ncbi:dienelactone hydrolase [Spizellomyces punctatus DAOM BR117]|uniref:Dienelactone hydrolase n=1 Tax=Spizellomyces punctatus (strain DAOM BR117) TaxID=645134 RepID=A0A0L0H8V2_SPIPD|nr:dienelactone hydrolase [Spizellomyces punctatus DAOM BR117]KNC97369.1 dienelactone hydrolase [Spizellomyces punctatus DAOM BR117]|eukprot:XP_016605409.1 dienelactone hydrolase [Spizellomyces punctatus DAOM BR117]
MPSPTTLLRPFVQQKSPAAYAYQYLLSTPPQYEEDSSKKWPLILFLHGAGESARGGQNDLEFVKRHGIPKLVTAYELIQAGKPPIVHVPDLKAAKKTVDEEEPDAASLPVPEETAKLVAETFITVSPQVDLTKGYGWNAHVLEHLLNEIEDTYRVDASRIYVTGVSMGGQGTWNIALHNPQRFAAIAPICGGTDTLRLGLIKHLPVWVFHGVLDNIIPITESEQAVEALQEHGGKVKYTSYPRAKHDSWTETYNNPEVVKWFLEHKKERNVKRT